MSLLVLSLCFQRYLFDLIIYCDIYMFLIRFLIFSSCLCVVGQVRLSVSFSVAHTFQASLSTHTRTCLLFTSLSLLCSFLFCYSPSVVLSVNLSITSPSIFLLHSPSPVLTISLTSHPQVTRVQGGWIYLRITFPFATTRTPSARTAANKKGKKADDRARRGTNRADEETTGPHSNPAPPPGYHLAGPSSSNPRRNIVDVPTAPYDGAPQPGVSSSSSWGRPSAGSNVLGASAWEDVPARYDYIPPAPLPPSALALLLLLFLLQQWQPPTRPSSTARPLLRGAPRRSWKCGLTPHAIWRMPFGSTSQVPPSTHPPTALAFGVPSPLCVTESLSALSMLLGPGRRRW